MTPMGKRTLNRLLLNPTTNVSYLNKEYTIIAYIIKHYENYNTFRNQLSKIKRYRKIVSKNCIKTHCTK